MQRRTVPPEDPSLSIASVNAIMKISKKRMKKKVTMKNKRLAFFPGHVLLVFGITVSIDVC